MECHLHHTRTLVNLIKKVLALLHDPVLKKQVMSKWQHNKEESKVSGKQSAESQQVYYDVEENRYTQ
jgi:hypothetical protein